MNTQKRAEVRHNFEEFLREKEELKAKDLAERQAQEEIKEKQEIAEMRRRDVHKAQPVRQ